MALPMLFWAAVLRPICAVRFIETARPALSSDGETTFEPEDRRASDLLNIALELPSKLAVVCADVLVLMTITADSFHESPLAGFSNCVTSLPRGASFVGRAPVFPAGHLRPPAAGFSQLSYRQVLPTL